jgi:hypothetical protein
MCNARPIEFNYIALVLVGVAVAFVVGVFNS